MSDDEEEDFSDKTQIFLPGGDNPLPPLKPAADENKGVLLKPEKPAPTATVVDFDITSGAGFGMDESATPDADQTASAAAASVSAAEPAAQRPPPVSASSEPTSNAYAIIAFIVFVALIALFFLR